MKKKTKPCFVHNCGWIVIWTNILFFLITSHYIQVQFFSVLRFNHIKIFCHCSPAAFIWTALLDVINFQIISLPLFLNIHRCLHVPTIYPVAFYQCLFCRKVSLHPTFRYTKKDEKTAATINLSSKYLHLHTLHEFDHKIVICILIQTLQTVCTHRMLNCERQSICTFFDDLLCTYRHICTCFKTCKPSKDQPLGVVKKCFI